MVGLPLADPPSAFDWSPLGGLDVVVAYQATPPAAHPRAVAFALLSFDVAEVLIPPPEGGPEGTRFTGRTPTCAKKS
jgi:hypothetical protein